MNGVGQTPSALLERLRRLDGCGGPPRPAPGVDPDVARFITTMERVVSPGRREAPEAEAPGADAVMARCRLLDRLAARAPEVVSGPLRLDRQYWIATQRPPHLPPRTSALAESAFVPVRHAATLGSGAKPAGAGLYTSTGLLGGFGMWSSYLELNRGSTLFGLPWHVWTMRVRDGARVLEITSAAEWVAFVVACPRPGPRGLVPDWARAADAWDGVHVTARAVAAMQGIRLLAGEHAVAPTYWDVETTFWLSWVFDSVSACAPRGAPSAAPAP